MVTPLILFLSGYLLCYLHAFLDKRQQQDRYSALWDDYRKLVNEFSIRTGGRLVYKPDRVDVQSSEPDFTDEYRILTPSMAEDEEEAKPQISAEDEEWLRENGALR